MIENSKLSVDLFSGIWCVENIYSTYFDILASRTSGVNPILSESFLMCWNNFHFLMMHLHLCFTAWWTIFSGHSIKLYLEMLPCLRLVNCNLNNSNQYSWNPTKILHKMILGLVWLNACLLGGGVPLLKTTSCCRRVTFC